MTPTVKLYTKDGCTLCDYVKDYFALRQSAFPHQLVEVDITQDQETFAYYRFIIPVVEIGQTTLKAPITNGELEQALSTLHS